MEKEKITLYILEVGIELEEDNDEHFYYLCNVNGKSRALYNENTILFLNQEKAFKYAENYVKNGVKNTYAMCWKQEENKEDIEDFETIAVRGYSDWVDINYYITDVDLFLGGIK